ncbi:unnamed protein product [Polarella glacialis]|uniref:Uncharacterized protein n=1 Tax=Polarella glacialis TaxID=89957 RepID=A0A813DKC7_POLGL|nr:unnamed protein product [Polarella glacialis]
MVYSGYRYHESHTHSWHEGWLDRPFACSFCDDQSHAAIFQNCTAVSDCTFRNLLKDSDWQQGLFLESLRVKRTLDDMKGNLERWASSESVLHVSVDMLRSSFNLTVACILRFIGYSESVSQHRFAVLDPSRVLSAHATHGRYAGSEAMKVHLRSQHPWSAMFAAITSQASHLLARQAAKHGCPTK